MTFRSMLQSNQRRKFRKWSITSSSMEGNSIANLVEKVWPTAESMGISKDLVYAAAEIKVLQTYS